MQGVRIRIDKHLDELSSLNLTHFPNNVRVMVFLDKETNDPNLKKPIYILSNYPFLNPDTKQLMSFYDANEN